MVVEEKSLAMEMSMPASTIQQMNSAWTISSIATCDVEEFTLSQGDNRGLNRRRDSSDNLFEIVPHCVIQGQSAKRVFSTTAGGDTVGLVLDNELLILEKDVELEACRRVQFASYIDFIVWRRSIILVGLSSSEIVLVDPNTFEIKESKKVCSTVPLGNQTFFTNAAIHTNPDPTKIDVVAVGVNGDVYSFRSISLSDGALDSTHDQNISVDIDVGSIRGTKIQCLEDSDANVVCASSPSRNILILGESNGTISLHDLEDAAGMKKELKISQNVNIKEFGWADKLKKIIPFEGLLFVLLSNGHLEILLDDVLIPTKPFSFPESSDDENIVHDFTLVMTNDYEIKLWLLYGRPDFSKNYVGIFGGPSFTPEFSVRVPSLAYSDNDASRISKLLFPTQISPFEEPFAFLQVSPTGTAILRMVETSTSTTIQKLIARGKFNEAAELSVRYGKDLDIVNKAKARFKFNEMNSLHQEPKSSDKSCKAFEEMVETLKKINDAAFVCSFCSQNGVPRLEWIKQLLSLGKDRVKDCSSSEAGRNLLRKIKTFFTFEQVYSNATLQDWLAFISDGNTMFQECSWFLNKREFMKCERVWKRHFDEFIPSIKLAHFGPFFVVLFEQKLKSPEAVALFKCILPYAVEKCAEDSSPDLQSSANGQLSSDQMAKVNSLIDIAIRQICSLEREKLWPSEALDFATIVISIVNDVMQTLETSRSIYEQKILLQKSICKEIRERMQLIVQNLVELADLKQHHSIRIPFQDYFNNDVFEVVSSMLYELFHRSEIERFINSFLIPFSKRKEMAMDILFCEHIKAVISDLPFHVNPLDIPHEERLICLISYIANMEIKLNSIRTIAEEWPVPWSPNIDNMVASCLNLNVGGDAVCLDLLNTIKIMRIQVPFRCLLNKYRLTEKKVQNYMGVVLALTRIIHVGNPEYYEDCLQLIKHTKLVDENKVKSIEFSLKLNNPQIPISEAVCAKWDARLLKRLLARSLQEFKMGHSEMLTPQELSRISEVSRILANILDDKKALEYLKLKEFIPSLENPDVVYDETYPFCVLTHIMSESSTKSSLQIINECKMLSDITFMHFPHILVAAACYFARPGGMKNELDKAWDIVSKVVLNPTSNMSSRSEMVHKSALTLAQFLLCHCPDASEKRLQILQDFLSMLTSIEDINATEEVIKMLNSHRIFMSLREQEIPLEREFLTLYNWVYIEGIPSGPDDPFMKFLKGFGTTIIKFGDKTLLKQSFGMVWKEYLGRISGRDNATAAATLKFVKTVRDLEKELLRSVDVLAEPETNKYIIDLVDSLNKKDISVTPYALRKRDKSRFLEKLLSANHYSLAAQTAVVFEVFGDYTAWSKILKGFMNASDIAELKKVLLDVVNVSELWMLPEFATGWKMVAETDPGFLDLCPIPLD